MNKEEAEKKVNDLRARMFEDGVAGSVNGKSDALCNELIDSLTAEPAAPMSFEEFEQELEECAYAESEDSSNDADVVWERARLRKLYDRMRSASGSEQAKGGISFEFWAPTVEGNPKRARLACATYDPLPEYKHFCAVEVMP